MGSDYSGVCNISELKPENTNTEQTGKYFFALKPLLALGLTLNKLIRAALTGPVRKGEAERSTSTAKTVGRPGQANSWCNLAREDSARPPIYISRGPVLVY